MKKSTVKKTVKTVKKEKPVKKVKEQKKIDPIPEIKHNPIPAPMITVAPNDEMPKDYVPEDAQRVLADFVYDDNRFIVYVKKNARN